MSLPTPHLDDRRAQDIVDEAKRLIPRYCPDWTDHNVSDPGVALIELFAWMTEMTLYRVNQVPEKHYLKFLELMGIQRFPGAAATAEIAFWLSAVQPEAVVVPAGTQVGTIRTEQQESIVFTTEEPVRIVVPVLTHCVTTAAAGQTEDRWDDLRAPRVPVDCFSSAQVDDAIYFGFAQGLARNILSLSMQASIEGRGVDPNNPPLAWEAWTGTSWALCRVLRDETGGLNRDGRAILICPAEHEAMTVGAARAFWVRCRMTEALPGQPAYQASPKIWALQAASLGGVAPASHADTVSQELIGKSDGKPGQAFKVARSPVLPRSVGETVLVRTADGEEQWKEVPDFATSGPDDQHFTWDSGTGEIGFGPQVRMANGKARQYGAIPRLDSDIYVTRYRYGGGAQGNVGAKTLSVLKSSIPFIGRVESLQTARGGVDPETIENLRVRGPMSLRSGQRAVTCEDFERLTLESGTQVARARCLPPARAGEPIRVLIVPRVEKPPQELALTDLGLSEALVKQVSEYLDKRRILTSTVSITPFYYQGARVVAKMTAHPGVRPEIVRDRALTALFGYINPLTGGPESGGWPFGREINVGEIFALLAGLEGVSSVDSVELFPSDLVTSEMGRQARQSLRLQPDTLFASFRHEVVVA